MPSKYFQNYGKSAVEINLIADLYDEAIHMQGFTGYYIPNTNAQSRDLIYGDDPLKAFDVAYPLDMYLVNTMDYGDEQDFFSKFGLEVRNQTKVQMTTREFKAKVSSEYSKPLEGDLIFIPFIKDTGELFEIKFTNTSKDLYVLGRNQPFYYELSLEPFKYNDESIDTGIDEIDAIEALESFKTTLDLFQPGSGNFIVGETVYQGTANNYIASAEVVDWDSVNTILTIVGVTGTFSNTSSLQIVGASSNSQWSLSTVDNSMQNTHFDNYPILQEVLSFIDTSESNPFGSLSNYN
jgi:hypothetical protein